MTTQIDYLFNGYNVAFKITYISAYNTYTYTSQFAFGDTNEAYDAAINELSN